MHAFTTNRRLFASLLSLALVLPALSACESTKSVASVESSATTSRTGARLYPGYGGYHRSITTNSPEAQRWFDQGIQLLYGFNHDEAIRSFREAAAHDPGCAMAWWGVSYANGLHVNNPEMTAEQSQQGYEAAQEALKRVNSASPPEQALINAVAKRYVWPVPADRKPLDQAYADAMEGAWKNHPNDADIGVLYAEWLMDLQPWDYWTPDGQPKGRINEVIQVIETCLKLNPQHPGANHFYIHAVEASPNPGRATIAADRLAGLVPGSGHLVHMPSHIYIRTGRYGDAVTSNERAVKVDDAYFKVAPPPRFYGLYFVHNLHFLAYGAMMEGQYALAVNSARRIERDIPPAFLKDFLKFADGFMPTTLHVFIRFGKWEEVLQWPEPPSERLVSRAMRHYARCVAYSAMNQPDNAADELAAFDAIAKDVPADWQIGQNKANDVLPMARLMAAGELAYRQGKHDEAFELLRQAVEREENLVYDEPPGWMQPVRHALGALLMGAGRAVEAEDVYRKDLSRHPNNGWSLIGLEQALLAQGRTDEAAQVARQRNSVWKAADVKPQSSCYCEPLAKK